MNSYQATLPGSRSAFLIAHLLPGDTLTVQTSLGERRYDDRDDPPGSWLTLYDDEDGLREMRFGTESRAAGNTTKRLREPVSRAARDIRSGGVAIVHREQRTYYTSTEWQPTTHELVNPTPA
ncbi:hypothetical protein [Nocardia pseudovaccinii]|uniref:hypothetical protein n=1 Tax=Nocardia pseudovaccinii TaxID=189540 RepID=UPI0007A3EE48|nr:hypothetical protein [Nocardia pseudovaccinii]